MLRSKRATGTRAAAARRSEAVGSLLLVGWILGGCGDDFAKYPATPDEDSANANVVVKVGSCTGTLVTPRIVLTASHCIRGSESPAAPGAVSCDGEANPYVSIGPRWLSPDAVFETGATKTKISTCQPPNMFGEDIALVYLTASVSPGGSSRMTTTVPRIVRPSLSMPPRKGGKFLSTPSFSGYSLWNDDYSTWLFRTRRVQPLVNLPSVHESTSAGTYFRFSLPDGNGVRAGDSGGPIFVVRPDRSRDVFAVVTMKSGDDVFAADLTAEGNRAWLLANVTERAMRDMVLRGEMKKGWAHTDGWLDRHGKTLDDWWGELDYSGPCDTVRDADCDGFWEFSRGDVPIHDDCPGTPDPEQLDVDDDGVGDDCPAPGASPASPPRQPGIEGERGRGSMARWPLE